MNYGDHNWVASRACRARRVEPVELDVSSESSSTRSTQPKCMGSTRRTCRVVSSRVESNQVEFGLYHIWFFSVWSFSGSYKVKYCVTLGWIFWSGAFILVIYWYHVIYINSLINLHFTLMWHLVVDLIRTSFIVPFRETVFQSRKLSCNCCYWL